MQPPEVRILQQKVANSLATITITLWKGVPPIDGTESEVFLLELYEFLRDHRHPAFSEVGSRELRRLALWPSALVQVRLHKTRLIFRLFSGKKPEKRSSRIFRENLAHAKNQGIDAGEEQVHVLADQATGINLASSLSFLQTASPVSETTLDDVSQLVSFQNRLRALLSEELPWELKEELARQTPAPDSGWIDPSHVLLNRRFVAHEVNSHGQKMLRLCRMRQAREIVEKRKKRQRTASGPLKIGPQA